MTAGGRALVDQLLADPPGVHAMSVAQDAEVGVWATERDCYLLLAEFVGNGARTLETGSGISTVLFAALGAMHTCITPAQVEADRIEKYCEAHEIPTVLVTFKIGCSDEILPGLSRAAPYDVVLIDGNHGFPTPTLDWYYGASLLGPDGLLVIDDVSLPAVAHLCSFVDRDPRFASHTRTAKWAAYRRVGDGDLRQDWYDQPFYGPPLTITDLPGRALRKVRRTLTAQGARR